MLLIFSKRSWRLISHTTSILFRFPVMSGFVSSTCGFLNFRTRIRNSCFAVFARMAGSVVGLGSDLMERCALFRLDVSYLTHSFNYLNPKKLLLRERKEQKTSLGFPAIYWCCYETVKSAVLQRTEKDHVSFSLAFGSGAISGKIHKIQTFHLQ